MIKVERCLTRRDFKLFERLPERLIGSDPNFLPPFPGTVSKILDQGHPFHRRGELLPYVAWRNGEPVGRIAAIVNRAHNEYHGDRVGFFGFLDFIDDYEVSSRLLETAEEDIRRHNLHILRGPYNPTSNDECGLLADGFDSPPFVLMPYNPRYYLDHYARLGLQQARDLYAYYISDATKALSRTGPIVERFKRKAGITVRCANLKKLEDEIRVLQSLYNETLGSQWGFVPLSFEDLEFAVSDLRQVLDPELVLIAEKDGEPVGISVSIPNVNEFMLKAKRSKGWLRILKFVWSLKTRRPREARLAILGVLPGHRNKGVAPAFYFETINRGINRYRGGEIGWVLDINTEVNKAAELLGAKRYKTYRIFEKYLAPGTDGDM